MLVELRNGKVHHAIKYNPRERWHIYGATKCGLIFYDSEMVNASERRVCKICQRATGRQVEALQEIDSES